MLNKASLRIIQKFTGYLVKLNHKSLATAAAIPKKKFTGFRLGMTSIALGAIVGTGYSLKQLNKPKPILNEQETIAIINDIPDVKPTKIIKYENDTSKLKLTLFQYQTCPFCCKVRAFLDFHGISYNLVEVDPVLRQATKWSPYKKVPILLAKVEDGYQPLNDSSMIISALESFLLDGSESLPNIVKCYPKLSYEDRDGSVKSEILNRYFLMFNERVANRDNEKLNEERKWRKWADEVLVHDLSPNVYRTGQEALQAFNWFSEVAEWEKHFPTWETYLMIYVGSAAMYLIGKRLKARHNLKDDVRQSLYDDCNHWVRAVKKKGTKFMGGDQPNLADLAVYGVLSSIEGCDAFKDVLRNTNIGSWYLSVREAINRNNRVMAFAEQQ